MHFTHELGYDFGDDLILRDLCTLLDFMVHYASRWSW